MTPEQFNALIAAGMSPQAIATNIASIPALFTAGMQPAQIAAALGGQQPVAAGTAAPAAGGNAALRNLRNAPPPTQRGQGLSHPEKTPLINGRGMYDGDFAITLVNVRMKPTEGAGDIFVIDFRIDESTHPGVLPGSLREHAIFQKNKAGASETVGLVQLFYGCAGLSGDWTDDFYMQLIGEGQPAKGQRYHLNVNTRPQRRDATKLFTDHRYSPIAAGEVLGFGASAPAVAVSVPVVNPLATSVPVQMPVAAMPAQAAPVATTTMPAGWVVIPEGWPTVLPYPSAPPDQWAFYVASKGG